MPFSPNKGYRLAQGLTKAALRNLPPALLWKKPYVAMILEGRKTATRRRKRPLVKVGKAYGIRAGLYETLSQKILVESLRRQRLGEMTEEDAVKEGSASLSQFRAEWESIYGLWCPDEEVWVVEFRLVPP